MREPVEKLIAPGADDKPTVEKVEQYYFSVQPWDKYRLLRTLLEQENPDLAIVFCRTKRGAEKLAKRLHADGIECREIHGNLAQNKRDRVMKGFRNGKFDVLIATDLASRGIDVADISHIINYDIPEDPEVYVHRVGRTARMGAKGKAFTFVMQRPGRRADEGREPDQHGDPAGARSKASSRARTPADWTESEATRLADEPSQAASSAEWSAPTPHRPGRRLMGETRRSRSPRPRARSAARSPSTAGTSDADSGLYSRPYFADDNARFDLRCVHQCPPSSSFSSPLPGFLLIVAVVFALVKHRGSSDAKPEMDERTDPSDDANG